MNWTENEDGPECSCGNPTVVKFSHDTGRAFLLCLFHTPEAGCWFQLPVERPDDWPWPIEQVIAEAVVPP